MKKFLKLNPFNIRSHECDVKTFILILEKYCNLKRKDRYRNHSLTTFVYLFLNRFILKVDKLF